MNVFDELEARGMIAQTTDRERIRELWAGSSRCRFISALIPRRQSACGTFCTAYGYGAYAEGGTPTDSAYRRRDRNGRRSVG